MGRKQRPRPFKLKRRNIAADETHADVLKVQQYLKQFGYLGFDYEPRVLDERTQEALGNFQRLAGLPVTSVIDPATADRIEEPRCGFPDTRPGMLEAALDEPPFQEGCKHEGTATVAYTIINKPRKSETLEVKNPIRAAFDEWQKLIRLDFNPVSLPTSTQFSIGWFGGISVEHDDGFPFTSNVIAHAFPPAHCGGPHAGKCHFNDDKDWDDVIHGAFFALQPVAIHEIGHLLGLGHINRIAGVSVTSVMNTSFAKNVDHIPTGDPAIALVQKMYGARPPQLLNLRPIPSKKRASVRKSKARPHSKAC